jgi:hypothetical protein
MQRVRDSRGDQLAHEGRLLAPCATLQFDTVDAHRDLLSGSHCASMEAI